MQRNPLYMTFPWLVQKKSPKRQCYDGKCLTTDFQIRKPRFVGLICICGLNPPTLTDFNFTLCYHWMGVGKWYSQPMSFDQIISQVHHRTVRSNFHGVLLVCTHVSKTTLPFLSLSAHTQAHTSQGKNNS